MIKRLLLLLSLLVVFTCNDLLSQSRAELKNSFYDAESWILFEAYNDALPLYKQLLQAYPKNANFKYRIGQCYINTPGEKTKALSFLEDAVKNINPDYKEGKFRESGAPYDALYYLANAYRINNELDKALETYEQFKKNLDPEVYDTAVVNLQIQSCLNAKELMGRPQFIMRYNLGNVINQSNSEYNPVISDNEEILVFSKSEPFYDALMYSRKTNGQWSEPQNMNELLQVDRDLFPTSLSADNKTLYLYSSADYDGNIYSSRFDNGIWSPPSKLNENINTKYWESHATISHDNNKLYFTSNRRGTYGGLDIYISKRDSTGDWGPAENLGPVVNSPYNEETPFLSKDDKTLFFSSRGHFNMGGYDIFYSTRLDNGEWSSPQNAGYPLNSTDDDVFYHPLNEDYKAYYSLDSPDGYGKQDIYRIEIFSDKHPRKFIIKGTATVADLLRIYNDSVKISVMNEKNPLQTLIIYNNPKTLEYEFNLPQGDYQLSYEGYGGEQVTRKINLPFNYPSDSFFLPGTVLRRTDFKADLNINRSRNILVAKGDSILFPLKVEPKSSLTIEKWAGDSIVSVQKFLISTSAFNYKMVPEKGDNRVIFKLADRFNNTATEEVLITREREVTQISTIRPEYSRVLSKKQTEAYLVLLKNRADANLLKVITESDIEREEFNKADDILTYLKNKAAAKNINPEVVDKPALKVAVMDNVLTQAAVDLIAKYSKGELRDILSGLDIYESNLKTWTDLQKYVSEKSGGRITPKDLDVLADSILTEVDPAIAIIRDKILIFSEKSETGPVLRKSVASTDQTNIKLKGKWLKSVYDESIKQGLTSDQLSEMFVIISTMPDTKTEHFLGSLIENSEEPLISSLKSIDISMEKIKSPQDLIIFLLTAKDRLKYPEESVFNSIANLIVSENIPADLIRSKLQVSEVNRLWILWVIIGASVICFFIIFMRRKKKEKK